jgi:hypothetical protein
VSSKAKAKQRDLQRDLLWAAQQLLTLCVLGIAITAAVFVAKDDNWWYLPQSVVFLMWGIRRVVKDVIN